MTLIECLDRIPIENVIGGCILNPEKIVFVVNSHIDDSEITRYKCFFENVGIKAELEFLTTDINDIDKTANLLSEVIKREKDCVLDINGGETPMILSLGLVYERLKNLCPIKIFNYTGEGFNGKISIRNFISLYGGAVLSTTDFSNKPYTSDSVEEFWKFVCKNPKLWNKRSSILNEFEKNTSGRKITLNMNTFKYNMKEFERKQITFKNTLTEFEKFGFITDYSGKKMVAYTYSDNLMRFCTKKAGNILELKCFFEAIEFSENGKSFFDDCKMGVIIDWDGIINKDGTQETRNEIDILAIHGLTPYFISCKNGSIEEAELYKLNSVAERFGGKYSVKMLIITDSTIFDASYFDSLKQRAKEMNIFLVSDSAKLDKNGWHKAFTDALKGIYNEQD